LTLKIDDIAERIQSLGHYTLATLKQFFSLTQFTEQMEHTNNVVGFVRELLTIHESLIIELVEIVHVIQEDFKDAGTADFLTGLIEFHQKICWMLHAHLKYKQNDE
jgi:starvation-inducible DNA-binding protein